MTEKLFYKDSHIKDFKARVVSCEAGRKGYEIILDKTAFFPEGGGQAGDSGYIGEARVFDTHEKEGQVIHCSDSALCVGAEYDCRLDWEIRYRRMQNHSGEHIVSGIVNRSFGYQNIGFHMGSDCVTIDFDGFLTPEQLREIEREANLAVFENRRIICSFPDAETLGSLNYRSKLELTHDVRIVEIEGIDLCACCAPHVSSTAEIGIIKILSSERRRRGGEGVRVSMLCGLDAYENLAVTHENNAAISVLLSARRDETAQAVERVLAEQERLKANAAKLSMALAAAKAEAIEYTEGNICIFDDILNEPALRELVNKASGKCGGIAAAFSGSDSAGYRYIIGSRTRNLRTDARLINEGIKGRGGGSPEMIQGSCSEKAENIEIFIKSLAL